MSDSVRRATIKVPVGVELDKVKGSRFVADMGPCDSVGEAAAFVGRVQAKFGDASHHCWAWRLGNGDERASDDGEPRDSAGAPILRHLAGADLVDVVCVVTRWFGGTKLGRGGLVRAYGAAAAMAIAAADIVVHVQVVTVTLTHAYDLTGAIDGVLAQHGARVTDETYSDNVIRSVTVVAAVADALRSDLRDATAGRVVIP